MTEKFADSVRVDRRTTIKWLAAAMAAAHAGCSADDRHLGDEIPPRGDAFLGAAAEPGDAGYGTDPDLLAPAVPWARTMTAAQLAVSAALCDMILPEDEHSPSAGAVGVPDFIDEWISAPYAQQRSDRELLLPGLEWLERQSRDRFGAGFAAAGDAERAELLDRIARRDEAPVEPAAMAGFFDRFRYLTVGAFYTTEAGIADVGYIGNVAIRGSYPGPGNAAMAHLAGVLEKLGLSLPA